MRSRSSSSSRTGLTPRRAARPAFRSTPSPRRSTNTPSGLFGAYFRDSKLNAADPVLHRVLPHRISSSAALTAARSSWTSSTTSPTTSSSGSRDLHVEYAVPRVQSSRSPPPQENKRRRAPRLSALALAECVLPQHDLERVPAGGLDFPPTPTRHTSRLTQVTRNSNNELFTLTKVLGNRAVNEFKGGYAFVDNARDKPRSVEEPSGRGVRAASPTARRSSTSAASRLVRTGASRRSSSSIQRLVSR